MCYSDDQHILCCGAERRTCCCLYGIIINDFILFFLSLPGYNNRVTMLGFRAFFLLFWLYLVFTCALLLFTKGFLLKRIVVNNSSQCEDNHWAVNNLWNGIATNVRFPQELRHDFQTCNRKMKPRFNKAVLVVIDGLRYDFLQHHKNLSASTALPFQNKMKKLHHILKEQPRNGKLYKFEADPPTTTMQRIKGMITG